MPGQLLRARLPLSDDVELDDELAARVDRVIYHAVNQGKGAALRTGFQKASGDIVLVQDADQEYDPNEYPKLLGPILDGRADVVFGVGFKGCEGCLGRWCGHSVVRGGRS